VIDHVRALKLSGRERQGSHPIDGVAGARGREGQYRYLKDLLPLDDEGRIKVNLSWKRKCPTFWRREISGAVRRTDRHRGRDGAVAGITAEKLLQRLT